MHSLPALSYESMCPHQKLIESRDGSSWPVGIKGAELELRQETALPGKHVVSVSYFSSELRAPPGRSPRR